MTTYFHPVPKPQPRTKVRKNTNRTLAQRSASDRDGQFCVWHKFMLGMLRDATEVHHIFGRARSDEKETCVSLCHTCHRNHHDHTGIRTSAFVTMMHNVYGYDYTKYRAFYKD